MSGIRHRPIYFDELAALSTDEGGEYTMRRDRDRVKRLEVQDPDIVMDIDIPEDLLKRS